jgi:hypothetical protein
MLLKASDGVLEYGVHQDVLGTEMKTAAIGGLELGLDEDVRLENRQSLLVNWDTVPLQALDPERRSRPAIRLSHIRTLLNDHEKPPIQLDIGTISMVPNSTFVDLEIMSVSSASGAPVT